MSRFGSAKVCLSVLVVALSASLFGASPVAAVAGYGDVDDGRYFAEPVQWSVDGDLTGIDGPCFRPDAPVTRGETAVWLWNLEGQPAASVAHPFSDVDPSQGDVVSWMAQTGITTGTSDTTFSPDDTLTRGQAAAFLYRLEGEPAVSKPHGFSDVVAGWQQDPVSWMAQSGITTGTSATTFSPGDTLSRAHLVTFLYRYRDEPAVTVDPNSPTCNPFAFTAIAAGNAHSCGLRIDGTADCWGSNGSGEADPPGGVFTAIAAGNAHSCGLRVDGTIDCWGNNGSGKADPPEDVFTSVTAGSQHSCGLRVDGTIDCWGSNGFGEADPPGGVFTAIAAGSQHSCGLRVDGTADCWGTNRHGEADPPGGVFTSLTAGGQYSCGLRVDGTAECWGSNGSGEADPPGGVFTAIAAGNRHSCGLRVDGTIACWGDNYYGRADPPGGVFTAVDAASLHSCGLRVDGTAECWGTNWYGQADPPGGVFTGVTVPSTNERVTRPIREGVTIHDDGRATVADPNLDGDNNPATGDDKCRQDPGGIACAPYYYADDPVLPARANEFVLIPNPGNPILVNPGTSGFETYQPVELQVGSWRQMPRIRGYDFDVVQIVVRFDPLPSLGADIYRVRLCDVTPYYGNRGRYVGTANGIVVGVYAIQDPDGRYRLARGDGWGLGQEPC